VKQSFCRAEKQSFAKTGSGHTGNEPEPTPVLAQDLGYYHPLTKATSVDKGDYTLSVGLSSAHITATTTLTLK
jgi:hypothetical protein